MATRSAGRKGQRRREARSAATPGAATKANWAHLGRSRCETSTPGPERAATPGAATPANWAHLGRSRCATSAEVATRSGGDTATKSAGRFATGHRRCRVAGLPRATGARAFRPAEQPPSGLLRRCHGPRAPGRSTLQSSLPQGCCGAVTEADCGKAMATRSGGEVATRSTSRATSSLRGATARHQRQANQPTNRGRRQKRSHQPRSSPGRVRMNDTRCGPAPN